MASSARAGQGAWWLLAGWLGVLAACGPDPVDAGLVPRWSRQIDGLGVSSPKVHDVDGDGVLDVVLGAGKEKQWGAVLTLDGRDGSELWRSTTWDDELYATACLVDVNRDDVLDVVIGRRRRHGGLAALDGRTGERLWGIHGANPGLPLPEQHFNTAVPCPDQDGDGLDDLLVVQSGGLDMLRQVGRLYVISAASGVVLHTWEPFDDREMFFVPCVEPVGDGWRLLVGTGGETLPGHLMALDFPSFEERWRIEGTKKGFVPGALLHDFDGDGTREAIVSTFNGRLMRVDMDTGAIAWERKHPRTETYVTPTLGRFDDGDDVLDVFAVFSEGRWPKYETRAFLEWIDGATGELLDTRDEGVQVTSSPVVLDVDGDGLDEVILAVNNSFKRDKHNVDTVLGLYSGTAGRHPLWQRTFGGYAAATPWLGDLDADGLCDLVFTHLDNVHCWSLGEVPVERVRWGEYRGPDMRGVVPRD